jgi:hypothetical protein
MMRSWGELLRGGLVRTDRYVTVMFAPIPAEEKAGAGVLQGEQQAAVR